VSDIREADTWLENNPICDADDLNKRERELVQAAWQAALSANGGEPVRPFGYVDPKVYNKGAVGGGISKSPTDTRTKPVWDHPAPPSVAVPEGWMLVRGEWGAVIDEVDRRADKCCGLESDFTVTVESEDYRAIDEAERCSPPPPDHIADAGKVVASNWKTAKNGQCWPHIGGKYLIKLNGVLQHEICEFNQGDDGMGGGEYFWDREDPDEAAPFNPEKDEWLPIDEAGHATPSVPENAKARAILDSVNHAKANSAVNRGLGTVSESLVLKYALAMTGEASGVLDIRGELERRLRAGKEVPVAIPESEFDETNPIHQAADAYSYACEIMEQHQAKRVNAGKDPGTIGSLCDGLAWLYGKIEELEDAPSVPENEVKAQALEWFADWLKRQSFAHKKRWTSAANEALRCAARIRTADDEGDE